MLKLDDVTKRFGDTVAVDALSVDIQPGELVTLLGPSGCGKTTTLRMIAGFELPTSGTIHIGGRDITRLRPQARGVGMVFQNYALFPHLDVYENVAFGLRVRRASARDIDERVHRALERVDLQGLERRKVQQLSGGQQQRVALARALAPEPPVLLLDEPLSNLDAALRERTRVELRQLLKRVGITSVFVTHDQEEAYAIADRIVLLDRGQLQQVGSPEELYRMPANRFVASFLGRANFLRGTVRESTEDAADVELRDGVTWRARVSAGAKKVRLGDMVDVLARPEALELSVAGFTQSGALAGTVVDRRFAGHVTHVDVAIGDALITVAHPGETGYSIGEEVAVRPGAGARLTVFPVARPAESAL